MAFTVDPMKLAYIAGLFDGEGTFTFHRSKKILASTGETSYYTVPWTSVVNTDIRLIEVVRAAFGGRISLASKPQKATHKQVYRWDARNTLGLAVCKALLPYLIAKQEQAKLCIMVGELNSRAVAERRNGGSRVDRRKPEWKVQMEDNAYFQMRELNRRGIRVQ